MKITTFILFYLLSTGISNFYINDKIDYTKYLHPVHVSFTTVEYFEKEKEFKILFKIFVDDFDLILNQKYGKIMNLSGGKWENNYVKTIDTYINDKFKLSNDSKSMSLKFDYHEFKEQAILLYYTAKHDVESAKFKIINKLMIDLYADQKNLLIFVFRKNEKALQFNKNNETKEILF